MIDVEATRKVVARTGYSVLQNVEESDVVHLAGQLGRVVPDPRTGAIVRQIRPQTLAEANANTLSSRYGMGPFPFHTEAAYLLTPPRYLLLYCDSPGSGARPTILLDGRGLVSALLALRRPATWVVRSGRPSFLCHVVEARGPRVALRYDAACMFPTGTAALGQREAIDVYAGSAERGIPVHWRSGYAVVLDNERFMHGRGHGDGPDGDRVLKRLIVSER